MSSIRVDGVFRTRTLGVAARGIPDQYADGKAAKIWHKYIGDEQQRTGYYKNKLLNLLREHKVHTVLDVACGTGVDSVFLVEEGFAVTSVDGSDKMLKYALKVRWARRKEPAFDKWVIEEGNWLSLNEADIEVPEGGFDALICMGNSFAHLPDFDENQAVHIQAIQNFRNMLKTGGILVIDHRNYDHILAGGTPPMKNIYYQSTARVDVKTSVLAVDGQYRMVTLDYCIHGVGGDNDEDDEDEDDAEPHMKRKKASNEPKGACKFRLSYYPHQLKGFNKLLKGVFGEDAPHTVLADFEPLESLSNPAYFIHIITKQ